MREGSRLDRRLLEVKGGDRVSWLNGLVTCDVAKLPPGEARHGLIVARKGKILTDVVIAAPHGNESLWLDVDAEAASAVHEHLEHHLIMEDVEILLRDERPRVLAGAGAREAAAARGAWAALPARGLIEAPEEVALSFAAADAGAAGDAELWDALRFLVGWPAFRADYDDAFYPQEAGIEAFAVAFDKGCYLGQEVVFMLQVRGKVKRRLALVELAGAARGAPVQLEDGKEVGEVRSVRGERAFVLLREGAWKAGTKLRSADRVGVVLG